MFGDKKSCQNKNIENKKDASLMRLFVFKF